MLVLFLLFTFINLSFCLPNQFNEKHLCKCYQYEVKNGTIFDKLHKKLPYEILNFEKINNECDISSEQACIQTCETEVAKWTHDYDFTKSLSDHTHGGLALGAITCIEINKAADHIQWETYANIDCWKEGSYLSEILHTKVHSAYDFSCVKEGSFPFDQLVFKLGDRVDPEPTPSTVTPSTTEPTTTPTVPTTTEFTTTTKVTTTTENTETTVYVSTTTGPTTPNPYPIDIHNCTCETHLFKNGVMTEKIFIPLIVDDFGLLNGECDNTSINDCQSYCQNIVSKYTDSYDLNKPVNSDLFPKDVVLGQLICDLFGKDMFHHQLILGVHLYCMVAESAEQEPLEIDTRIPTELKSKFDFSCYHGKFVLGDVSSEKENSYSQLFL